MSARSVDGQAGGWAAIESDRTDRILQDGDVITLQPPHVLRMIPVDARHPNRVAVMRGPVVMALEGAYHDPNFALPKTDAELKDWLVEEPGSLPRGIWSTGLPAATYPTSLKVVPPDKRPVRLRFRPFYEMGENYPYFMYFDRDKLPWKIW